MSNDEEESDDPEVQFSFFAARKSPTKQVESLSTIFV
jgi:hypothetical protein